MKHSSEPRFLVSYFIYLLLKVLILLCFQQKYKRSVTISSPNYFLHMGPPVFTVLSTFSKIGDALVKTFCILPHFYSFLYPGYSIRLPSRKSALPLKKSGSLTVILYQKYFQPVFFVKFVLRAKDISKHCTFYCHRYYLLAFLPLPRL